LGATPAAVSEPTSAERLSARRQGELERPETNRAAGR
jgi:hypothetical protein